jgi:hypothetical protein
MLTSCHTNDRTCSILDRMMNAKVTRGSARGHKIAPGSKQKWPISS